MPNYFQASWKIKDAIRVLSVTVVLVLAMNVGAYFLVDKIEGFKMILGVFILQSLILLCPLGVLSLKKFKKINLKELGFGSMKFFKYLSYALAAYLIYIGLALFISVIIVYGGLKIPGYQIPEQILPMFGGTTLALTVAGIIIVILAPIVEEVFFRGFLLQSFASKIGWKYSAILTSAIFAVVHFRFESVIPIYILGIVMSVLFIRTRSIWPGIIFHIINNLIAFTLEILIMKGVIPLDF